MKIELLEYIITHLSEGYVFSMRILGYDRPIICLTRNTEKIELWLSEGQNIYSKCFYLNNLIHRDYRDGPAYQNQRWHSNGKKMVDEYTCNGVTHRPTSIGPAEVYYDEDGIKGRVVYRKNGKKHRPLAEGPAEICFDENLRPTHVDFFLNNIRQQEYLSSLALTKKAKEKMFDRIYEEEMGRS